MSEFLRFTLTAEFHEDDNDLPEMLRAIADQLETAGCPSPRRWPIRDVNGNTIGSALLTEAAFSPRNRPA